MSIIVVRHGDDVALHLKEVAKRVERPLPALKKIGSYIAQANRRQFSSHGTYYGTPWKPLKPDYAQWKLRSGYGRKILVLSGGMKASFTSRPMAIEQYSATGAVFGSDHWLAKFHQYGTHRNGKRVIPPRPIIGKNKRLTAAVKDIIKKYVTDGKAPNIGGYL